MEAQERPISTTSANSAILEKGLVLQDRYEILSLRALGGMSAIYEGRDLRFAHTTRRCAIKEIVNAAPDANTRHLNLRNFEREANILASLSHPAIPHIFDYFGRGDRAYLVLEYVDGEDLEAILERSEGFLPEDRVLGWALQVANVLDYLHTCPGGPIVFRDVKPSNIMLATDQRIMLVDFGIAKVFADKKRGTMVGTEGYSPPEQYRGLVGPPGDIYALGATLHHLLTRQDPRLQPPFSFHEFPVRSLNPAISPETEALVMKCLEYDADRRFASATELAQSVRAILGRKAPRIQEAPAAVTGDEARNVVVWEFACEDELRSSPTIAAGVLYIGSYDHNLYALDAKNGTFLWKFPTEGGICATPCILDGKLLIGSEDHGFYAVSGRTGRLLWTFPTGGRVRSTAMAAYGHVFFGSDDGSLYALNAEAGHMIWSFRTAGPVRGRPLLVGETIIFGSEDGQVYAVDMGSGEMKWKQRASQGVVSSPCLNEGLVYLGSRDWNLYAFSARAGWPVWRFRAGSHIISSPTVADGIVYFGCVDTHVYALDARSGRLAWKSATEGQVVSSPIAHKGAVYIGSVDTHVYCFEATTGKQVWRLSLGGGVVSSPAIADDLLYAGSLDGRVVALPL